MQFHSFIVSDPNLSYKSITKPTLNPNFTLKNSSLSKLSWHIQDSFRWPIVSARKRAKRSSGSSRSTKILLQSAYMVASKLKIVPEPLDLLIGEICGGNGGGRGVFLKGYGGGGSGGGRRRNSVVFGVGIVLILALALSIVVWREFDLDMDMVFGALGLSLFGLSIGVWKRGALDWVLGFCCCAVLGGFVLKDEFLQRGLKFLGTLKIARRSRRRRRRWF